MNPPRIIRVIDFETTGMDPEHGAQVCEVGFCDIVDAGDGWKIGQSAGWLCGVEKMPPEVRAVHHIRLEECAGKLAFEPAMVWALAKQVGAVAVCAHNLEFEAKFWGDAALPLICTYKSALRVWPKAPSHSNGVLRYWLEDQGKIAPEDARCHPAHRAQPDCYVTAHILMALLATEKAADLVRWTKEPRLLPTCPLGKFRGKPWPEVETGFLSWMLNQPSMEPDLKWNAQRELDRRQLATMDVI